MAEQERHPRFMRHLVSLLRPSAARITLAGGAMIVDSLLTALRPWPLKVLVDRVLTHRPTRVPFIGPLVNDASIPPMRLVYAACITTLLIAVGTGVMTYFFTQTMGEVARRFTAALRRSLFAHMQRLSLRFHDRSRTGDLITRLTGDIGAIQDVVSQGSILLGSNLSLLAAMLSIMLWLNWRFALISLSLSPILFLVVLYHSRKVRAAARIARTSDGLLAALAQETLASIRVVQGLAQERQQDKRFHGQSESSLQAYLQSVRYQARVAPLVDLLAAGGLAIVMWYGTTRVLSGELSTGDVIVFFAYVTNLYAPLKALTKLTMSVSRATVAAERISDVLDVESEVRDLPGASPAPRLRGRIELRQVTFAYDTAPGPGGGALNGKQPGAKRPVLKDISLTIEPGERVAIVGPTGAGKSTLVGLIPRFYDPALGEVLIDGHDARSFGLDSLREQVGLVLQDSLLFSGTVRENIAFGRPDATEAEIVAAAVAASADGFIRALPDGYDTPVSERGSSLSGGQKQRIAIARAILRDAPILILAEPTSNLDPAAEHALIQAMAAASRGRTTLMIAHRLATVRTADRIIVLEDGQIVDDGAHEALLCKDGLYARLHALSTH
jgi:subfamily B ATP-binding cassette protein MsbA